MAHILAQYSILELVLELNNEPMPVSGLHLLSGLGHCNKDDLIPPVLVQECIDVNDEALKSDSYSSNVIVAVVDYIFPVFYCQPDIEVSYPCLKLPKDVLILILGEPL